MKTDTPSDIARSATQVPGGAVQPPAATTVHVDIQLRAVEGSDRPVLANFTVVQSQPGMVFVDFGFLDPRAMNAITRAGRAGTKPTGPVVGQLASRIAMDLQTASQLARQLEQPARRTARDAAPPAADSAVPPLQ